MGAIFTWVDSAAENVPFLIHPRFKLDFESISRQYSWKKTLDYATNTIYTEKRTRQAHYKINKLLIKWKCFCKHTKCEHHFFHFAIQCYPLTNATWWQYTLHILLLPDRIAKSTFNLIELYISHSSTLSLSLSFTLTPSFKCANIFSWRCMMASKFASTTVEKKIKTKLHVQNFSPRYFLYLFGIKSTLCVSGAWICAFFSSHKPQNVVSSRFFFSFLLFTVAFLSLLCLCVHLMNNSNVDKFVRHNTTYTRAVLLWHIANTSHSYIGR